MIDLCDECAMPFRSCNCYEPPTLQIVENFTLLFHPGRPDWDSYFLNIAEAVALRADCTRRRVGAVIVNEDFRIVSTGYNGAPSGEPGCLTENACPRGRSNVAPGSSYDTGEGACIAVHAEQNALLYAGRDFCIGATLYITDEPCDGCWRFIRASGVSRVVWPEGEREF